MSYEDTLYESWEDYMDQQDYLESIAPVVGASAAYAESEYTEEQEALMWNAMMGEIENE